MRGGNQRTLIRRQFVVFERQIVVGGDPLAIFVHCAYVEQLQGAQGTILALHKLSVRQSNGQHEIAYQSMRISVVLLGQRNALQHFVAIHVAEAVRHDTIDKPIRQCQQLRQRQILLQLFVILEGDLFLASEQESNQLE